jgi:hypothetical protein
MKKNHAKISLEKGVVPTVVRFKPTQMLSCRDFLKAVAVVILVTLGVLGVGDTLAQAPPGGTPSAKTTIERTAPAKVAVTDKDREFMQLAIDKMRQAGVVDKTGGPFGWAVCCP